MPQIDYASLAKQYGGSATASPPPVDERAFRSWYGDMSKRHNLAPDPDTPDQFYDYRGAFRANAAPDASGHWPSQFKRAGHPNEIVGGFNTRTGERAPGTPRASEQELVTLGWDAATAKRLADTPELVDYAALAKQHGGTVASERPNFRAENARDDRGRPVINWEDLEKKGRSRNEFGNFLADAFVGALKGGGQTAVNLGRFMHMVPGVSDAVDWLYGDAGDGEQTLSGLVTGAQPRKGLSSRAFEEADRVLEPTNTAQSIGKGAEQIAEAFVPSTMAAKVVAKAPTLTRMAVEGAAGAGTAAAQGAGVPGTLTAGAVSAVVPGGAAVVRRGRDWLESYLQNPNPLLRDAINYVRGEGVPIDLATQSGRTFVANVQKRAGDSMGGSNVATNAQREQADAMADLGRRLTAEAKPGTSSTAITAGENVVTKLDDTLKQFDDEATAQYEKLRQIEQKASSTRQVPAITEVNPATGQVRTVDMPMQAPAFLTQAKKNLAPMYAELLRENALVPLTGDRGRALVALSRIVDGPDFIPLTELDAALGSLKAMARGAELPQLRTKAQGTAAAAVKELEKSVMSAAQALGPDAVAALQAGRKATIQKYAVQDVRELLGDLSEPVKVFKRLTDSNDAGIKRLEAVKALAPDQVQEIGQAFLQGMMDKGTAEGVFKRADGLWADWNRIGQATKSALFTPQLKQRLDRFFLVAKKIQENPNPSGTASAANVFNVGTAPLTYALAKVMYGKAMAPPEMESFVRKALTGGLATTRVASEQ